MNVYKNKNLLAAIDLYVREQDAALPRGEDLPDATPSAEMQARMARVFARRKRGFYVLFGTAGRRAASIVAAVLVAAAVTTASVEAWREPVWGFFTRVYQQFTQVFFADDTPDTPQVTMELHLPAALPDGYAVEQEEELPYVYRVTYTDPSSNSTIRYTQQLKERIRMQADTEEVQYEDVTIGEYQGFIYSNKEIITIFFSDNLYTYTISGTVSADELLKIAESVK